MQHIFFLINHAACHSYSLHSSTTSVTVSDLGYDQELHKKFRFRSATFWKRDRFRLEEAYHKDRVLITALTGEYVGRLIPRDYSWRLYSIPKLFSRQIRLCQTYIEMFFGLRPPGLPGGLVDGHTLLSRCLRCMDACNLISSRPLERLHGVKIVQ
eukprot:scaffold417575_cov38-Prasinocladus_malaysianus.AAC.1